MLILFGSQTGCAEEVAHRIAREGRRRRLDVYLYSMDDFDRSRLIHEPIVVFVCSTTGQGDEPDNMRKFWRFLLRKNLPGDALSETNFAVFGLGDSSYARFNFPAKKLFKRLVQLGAQPLLRRGDGDDQHYLGVDGALDPWLDELWGAIAKATGSQTNLVDLPLHSLPQPNYTIEFDESENLKDIQDDSSRNLEAIVVENRRLTAAAHFQDIRHISFQLRCPGTYNPGDVAVFNPENLSQDINLVLRYFGWEDIADNAISIRPLSPGFELPRHWPRKLTLRVLFEKCLDIFGRPRRYFFELLSFFASDPLHVDKLKEFSTAEGQSELYTYCHRLRRTTFEVLQDFPSVKLPLKYLLDLIPPMRPRSYSISSSPLINPSRLDITVAIVSYSTKLKKPRTGVCTKFLSTLEVGSSVALAIKRGTFRLPPSETPVLCIGTGTGLAPLRSLLQHRIACGEKENILFFGCRSEAHDFLYREELQAFESSGSLKLFTSFSRDSPEKVYVQHAMKQQADLIWRVLSENGSLFFAGNAQRIPNDVRNALKGIIESTLKTSPEDTEKYFQELERSRRYQSECWS